MRKLYFGTTILAAFCLIASLATAAHAAFAGEAKEGSVKLSAKEAISFTIEAEKKVKFELTCGTIKGEGAVMEHAGIDGEEPSGDTAPSTPTKESSRVALKLGFESCHAVVEGKSGSATVSANKCRFEAVADLEGKEKEEGLVDLPTSESKSACIFTIEASKCRVEFGDKGGESENESLSTLKLKALKEGESEIESGSVVKLPVVQTSGCGVAEKTEGAIHFTKGVAIKGAGLVGPHLTIDPPFFQFGQLHPGEESILEGVFEVKPEVELEITGVSLALDTHFSIVKNTCTKGKKGTEPCEIGVKFRPLNATPMRKEDYVVVNYKVGTVDTLEIFLVKGTAVP